MTTASSTNGNSVFKHRSTAFYAGQILPEWTNPENMPFANPVDYMNVDMMVPLPTDLDEFSVHWLVRVGRIGRLKNDFP